MTIKYLRAGLIVTHSVTSLRIHSLPDASTSRGLIPAPQSTVLVRRFKRIFLVLGFSDGHSAATPVL